MLEVRPGDDFYVDFLRRNRNSDCFKFPTINDRSVISKDVVKAVLKTAHNGKTLRQQSYIKFLYKFHNLDVR